MSSKTDLNPQRRQLLLASVSSAGLMFVSQSSLASSYPNAAVKFIVPFPPGGTVDTVTRLLTEQLASQIGQVVVVENRGGAGGTIGAKFVSQTKPDGYSLLLTASNQVINPLILKTVPYDPFKDFTPISYIGYVPQLVLVKADFPANTFQEFLKIVKEKPDLYTWATSSLGTAGHLAEELINQQAGLKMRVIPYKGGGPALMDTIAGHTTAMIEPTPSAMPHVKSGRLKALAVTSIKRAGSLPHVPTVAESGLNGFELPSWYGIWGPANIPDAVALKMYQEVKKALLSESLKKRLDVLSFEAVAGSPSDLNTFMRTETDKYAKIIKTAGISID
jgi:tripartite-type tricarboxylate transporter receptor subunit TctC